MPKIFRASEKRGGRVTIIFDNADACTLIVSSESVFVRYHRVGIIEIILSPWISALLYSRNMAHAVDDAARLSAAYPTIHPPLSFRSSVLTAFANAIWRCSTAVEVRNVLSLAGGDNNLLHS